MGICGRPRAGGSVPLPPVGAPSVSAMGVMAGSPRAQEDAFKRCRQTTGSKRRIQTVPGFMMITPLSQLSRFLPWVPGAAAVVRPVGRPVLRRPRAKWPPSASGAALQGPSADAGDADGLEAARCGWYDSSHELQSGLVVLEHSDPQALVSELPPSDWLELYLEWSALTPPDGRC